MADAPTLSAREIARLSTEEIFELAAETSRRMASLAGLVVLLTGELDRREGWRDDGATSVEDWLVERTGSPYPRPRPTRTSASGSSTCPTWPPAFLRAR